MRKLSFHEIINKILEKLKGFCIDIVLKKWIFFEQAIMSKMYLYNEWWETPSS